MRLLVWTAQDKGRRKTTKTAVPSAQIYDMQLQGEFMSNYGAVVTKS